MHRTPTLGPCKMCVLLEQPPKDRWDALQHLKQHQTQVQGTESSCSHPFGLPRSASLTAGLWASMTQGGAESPGSYPRWVNPGLLFKSCLWCFPPCRPVQWWSTRCVASSRRLSLETAWAGACSRLVHRHRKTDGKERDKLFPGNTWMVVVLPFEKCK